MSLKTDFLAKKLQAYLDRKAVPMSLRGKPDAQAAEVRALVSTLCRYAPDEAEGVFWDAVERELDENPSSEGRGWPSVAEVRKACVAARPKGETKAPDGNAVDTFAINAGRFERGEPVGDQWLYGRLAQEIVARGLVTEARINQYRSGLFFAMKDVWGEDRALAVEADYKARHADAAKMGRATGKMPQMSVKRMAVAE